MKNLLCSIVTILGIGVGGAAQAQPPAPAPTVLESRQPAADIEKPERETRPTTAEAVDAPMPSWGSLFTDTVRDFKHLPSRTNFTVLGIGAVGALGGSRADVTTSRFLSGSTGLHEPLEPGAIVGATQYQIAGAIAAFAIGRATHSSAAATLGADLFRAQLISETTAQALKFAVRRTRPDSTSFSFPSGHTSSAFASATVLQQHFGWKIGAPAYAVASYVAASRIQMKRHYLSDVAFGAALGIVAGRTVTIGHGNARFGVSPMAAPGGAGVSFNWLGKK